MSEDESVLSRALSLAHARRRSDFVDEHFEGDQGDFFDKVQGYVVHVMNEMAENEELRRDSADNPELYNHVVLAHVSMAMFLAGRAYEELTLNELGSAGAFDFICTKCKQRKREEKSDASDETGDEGK